MNPLDPFNQVSPFTTQPNPVFEPKFINLDYVFYKLYVFFNGGNTAAGTKPGDFSIALPNWWTRFFGGGDGQVAGADTVSLALLFGFVKDLIYVMILFLITLIIYCAIRIFEIRDRETEYLNEQIEAYRQRQNARVEVKQAESAISRNEAWIKVLKNLGSENEGDWKMAIIDADKMLDILTDQLNLPGENLGEKLKAADRERFRTLNQAWDAHNVRNRIAHEGTSFTLTKREADRVIALYEQVFREFGYI